MTGRGPSFINVIRVLAALREGGEMTRAQIRFKGNIPPSTIYRPTLLSFLCEMELVERRVRDEQEYYVITENGRVLVDCLEKIGLLTRILAEEAPL